MLKRALKTRWDKTILSAMLALLVVIASGCDGSNGSDGIDGSDADQLGTMGSGLVSVEGVQNGDPEESIYVKKVGNGPQTLVFLPGNNTSGVVFNGMLNLLRADNTLNQRYTVYAFDYRGSGNSSYNTPITGLSDFASDFESVMDKIGDFPDSDVTLVGYSMGFAVALELAILNPDRYSGLIGLAPVGTRGTRVQFNASSAGADSNSTVWQAGDYVPINDDNAGIFATEFHQRSWQGVNRTYDNVKFIWDMLVFNDTLDYDPVNLVAGDTSYQSHVDYEDTLFDVLYVQYMPESLYYTHKFNVSALPGGTNNNSDGSTVTVAGDDRLGNLLSGKTALLVKAKSDFVNWRGDLVITDNIIATSKYDLKQAGATTTAVMIEAGQNYDHGLAIVKASQMVQLIDAHLQTGLNEADTEILLGATVDFHGHAETIFETSVFTGL